MIQSTRAFFDCTPPEGPTDPTLTPGELCPTAITLSSFSVQSFDWFTSLVLLAIVILSSLVIVAKRRKMV